MGAIDSGAVQFGHERGEIILCEGLQEGLALRRMHPNRTVWAAIAPFGPESVMLPDECSNLVIAVGNDTLSIMRAEYVAQQYARRDRDITLMHPDEPHQNFHQGLVELPDNERPFKGALTRFIDNEALSNQET